jgi:O-antigen/teichoic acid export membrane protein
MSNKITRGILPLFRNTLFKNSSWGIISQGAQTVLMSLFFVILARKYSTDEFSKYIVATVLYQLMTAFSTMGLSQWFIRELAVSTDKTQLVNKFLKIQIYFGLFFYVVNLGCSLAIYNDHLIYMLSLFVGINIVFDNIINAIKCLNIADFEQKKTFIILTIETVLKFLMAGALFIYPFSTITLSVGLILIRFITLNLFLKLGSSSTVSIKDLWAYKISFKDVWHLVYLNWPFVVIGGVSIINWRVANILISKMLTIADVATYEIGYKIFSIAQILPVIVSTTVFPILIKLYNEGNIEKFSAFYRKTNLFYLLFGLLSFTFIYSFADVLIPLAFGAKYPFAAYQTKYMFLTILIFPTAFLQANMIIAMKLEKKDMLFNVIMMCVNVTACAVGLYYWRSVTAVNYSIFLSFLVFHILQDVLLIRRKIGTVKKALSFYLITGVVIGSYMFLSQYLNPYLLFALCWMVLGCLSVMIFRRRRNTGKDENESKETAIKSRLVPNEQRI